jgi:tRNA dimethylallyltransferase
LTDTNKKYLIVIAGPTAVGKTAISIQLAQQLHCDIISADSRQLYKELSIGTAKVTPNEMQGVKHHFLDFKSITEPYNAGMYEKEVLAFLNEYFKYRNTIIMCGGTGMYIDAVCKGMDEFEPLDENLRKNINESYKQKGITWLQEEVKRLDPIFYEIVDQQNPARLIRALEVCLSTEKPYSEQRKGIAKQRDFETIKILVNDDRATLYERINKRVDLMMQQGLLQEAKEVYPARANKALSTVGYKELFDYFDEKYDLERAVELIKQNSRRYAKRQLTWFNNDGEYSSFVPNQINELLNHIQKQLTKLG